MYSLNPPRINYTQGFTFTTNFNKSGTDNIQIMPFLNAVSSIAISSYNYFNVSGFNYYSGNTVSFTLNVSYSAITQFCLSVLLCNYTNLKTNSLLNATVAGPFTIDPLVPSSTMAANANNNFWMNPVYGPIYDYKCIIGFNFYKIYNQGQSHSIWFNFSSTLNANITTDNSSVYSIQYSTFCFVSLQCQYLFQQYYVLINDCQATCTIPNCTTCSTATSCQQCEPGYFISSLMRCQACISNCTACSNNATCDTCNSGYFFNLTSLQCDPCFTNCLSCIQGQCNKCIPGYYPAINICYACINYLPNCISCSSSTSCVKCAYGYAVSYGKCSSCSTMAYC